MVASAVAITRVADFTVARLVARAAASEVTAVSAAGTAADIASDQHGDGKHRD